MKILQNVVLKSETNTTQLLETLTYLFKNNILTDVTLVGDDSARVEAHRLVLCVGSSVFRNFLLNNSHSHPLIYMKGIKQNQFESIMQFLYQGETTISQDSLNEFLKVANDLEINGLDNECFNEDSDNGELELQNKVSSQSLKGEDFQEVQDNIHLEDTVNNDLMLTSENITSTFVCDKCDFSGLTEESLRKHSLNLHELSEMKSENKLLDVEDYMKLQKSNPVSKDLDVGCVDCGFVSKNWAYHKVHTVNVHQRYISGKSNARCKCTVCDKEFSQYWSLYSHHNRTHDETKNMHCNQCDYVTARKDNFLSHTMLVHENRGAFNCNKCSFKTMRPGAFKAHMIVKHQEMSS